MTSIQAVTRGRHGSKRWRRSPNYLFTRQDALIPLNVKELPKAMQAMAVGFVKTDAAWQTVAIQGLVEGQNLFIDAEGRWLGSYIPGAYRVYPFRMGRNADGEQLLCIDEASGLLADDESGEAFFDSDGKPTPIITEVLEFFRQAEIDKNATRQVCALLQQHDLIEPWPISVQQEEAPALVQGLYRINESRLNALPAPELGELRNGGALLVAYCQLLSMQNLAQLGQMAAARVRALKLVDKNPGLPLFDDSGIISFENL